MKSYSEVLPSWALALIRFTGLQSGAGDACMHISIIYAPEGGADAFAPSGRFVVGGKPVPGAEPVPVIMESPAWERTRARPGAPLIKVDTIMNGDGNGRPDAGPFLLDIGLNVNAGLVSKENRARNAVKLLDMYEIDGWPDATGWMTRTMDTDTMGHVISLSNRRNDCESGPLPILLALRGKDGGPAPYVDEYAMAMTRSPNLPAGTFMLLRDVFNTVIAPFWYDVIPRNPDLEHARDLVGHPAWMERVVRTATLAVRSTNRDVMDEWNLLFRLLNGYDAGTVTLVSMLDDRRAAWVASKLLLRRGGHVGDDCLNLWNPLRGIGDDDAPTTSGRDAGGRDGERRMLMESKGVKDDILGWIDASMSCERRGEGLGTSRMTTMATEAGRVVAALSAVRDTEWGCSGYGIPELRLGEITAAMDGSEPDGAEALAAWWHDGGSGSGRVGAAVSSMVGRMFAHHAENGSATVIPYDLMRLLRVITHELRRGGDAATVMGRLGEVMDRFPDEGRDMAVLRLQAWMDGPSGGLPLGFFTETMRTDGCLV